AAIARRAHGWSCCGCASARRAGGGVVQPAWSAGTVDRGQGLWSLSGAEGAQPAGPLNPAGILAPQLSAGCYKSGVAASASDGNFNGGEAHRYRLGNFFTVSQAIFDVQSNGVLDVRDRLFVGLPLAVTALERRAGHEIAVLVAFNNDRKRQVLHARSIFLLQTK